MPALTLHPISEIITDIAAGKMVIVVDDPGRENEADLVASASMVTPEMIAFMANHGRGLICAPITASRAKALDLPPMTARNTESMKTAFTVSVDAAEGITTGISAADRARTIHLLATADADTQPLVQPGHIFPLQAVPGGVLRRAGHTEAAVDLCEMVGMYPAGIVCEIMAEDGSMSRLPELERFADEHGLKILSIAQIIAQRRRTERLIERVAEARLPTRYGPFQAIAYKSHVDTGEHIAASSQTHSEGA